MITDKTLEAFKAWDRNNCHHYIDMEPSSICIEYNDLEDDFKRMVLIEFFHEIGPGEIGGHSISDMIYVSLKNNDIMKSMELAIAMANKNYNDSH